MPEALKIARVLPIPKKQNNTSISNFRPISILSALAKVLEEVVRGSLNHFLKKTKFFSKRQYGFRPETSTANAAVDLTMRLQEALDKEQVAIGLFLDLAKAFDTVDHQCPLFKLQKAGLEGSALKWFSSYLTGRKQYVSCNDTESTECAIEVGVPQGNDLLLALSSF